MAIRLVWGFTALDAEVRTTADRDVAAAQLQDFVGALQGPRQIAEMFAELLSPATLTGRRTAADRCASDRRA